jgi:hypothetical protein
MTMVSTPGHRRRSPVARFSAKDDLLHPIAPDVPHGRESFAWAVPVPEEGLLAFLYMSRDADTGRYGRMVAIADGMSGETLYRDVATDVGMDEGEDFDDCRVAGLHLRQPEPLITAELGYAADGVRVEVAMRALHEPFSWHDNRDGCADWIATDRYEQSVATRGVIEVAGRTVRFDSMGHRDHSWGPRDWRPMQHWKWMNAATPDGATSLHAFVIFALGDRLVNGYANRDGVLTPLTAIDVRQELDLDTMLHRRVRATCTDENGREMVLDATGVAGLGVPARHMRMNEVACTATLDGAPAFAHVEMGWPETYIREFTG